MTKSICTYRTVVFADEGAVSIVNTFGNTDDKITVFLKSFFKSTQESILVKSNFRKVNEQRIVSFVFTRKGTGSSDPSGMTPHDLDDRDGFFFVDVGICRDFTDCGSNVFGGTSEARGMVGIYQIIINRLRFTDHADRTANACRVAGKFTDGIHRIIATNIEEPTDIEFLKFAEKCRINRIFERFRQFVAAGTEIGTRGMG